MMSPYEADSMKIPTFDLYTDVPFYGRYYPELDDFRVNSQHINCQSNASLRYWTSVIGLCTEEDRIYPADEGGRDVFALGTVIVKSSHLHDPTINEIDFSYADANETWEIALSKAAPKDVRVPDVYFAGKVYTHALCCRSVTYFGLDEW